MPDPISIKPVQRRSLNLSTMQRPARLRPIVRFKFKMPVKKELATAKLNLKRGGQISLTALRNPSEFGKIVPKADPAKDPANGNWACSVTQWSGDIISREAAILNPNFHLMYPGATYKYESIADGSYKALPYARKPITVSVDGVNFSKPAVTVTAPSQSTIREAIAKIKGSQKAKGGTRTFGSTFEVLSEEDLVLRTGGSGYFLGFGGSHQFDYKSERKSHRYFIEVSQAYYTVSVDDTVNEPTDFFFSKTEAPGKADAIEDNKVDPNWVYVESVTYGRLLQLMIESDESLESVGLDIEAHANMIVAGGEGTFSMDQKNRLQKSTITLTAIGGQGDLAGQLVNSTFADLRGRIDRFFSGTDDEVPISYGLRTLDGALVGTRMTTDFTSRQCSPVASKYKVTWQNVFCERSNDQDSDTNPEDCQLLVRVRAWDGKGKDVVDIAGKNAAMLNGIKLGMNNLWTFVEGSSDHEIALKTGDRRDCSHRHLTFLMSANDKSAKFGIRADVHEFDGIDGDDDFLDQAKTYSVAEVGNGKNVVLTCTHGLSKIVFNLRIEPVFE